MRLRHQAAPLLLLLLPVLAQAVAIDTKAKPGSVEHLDDLSSTSGNAAPPSRNPETGTQDAPVDGLDGKPHAGPYVESGRRKPVASVEDLDPKKAKSLSDEVKEITKGGVAAAKDKLDDWATPDKKEMDGVMSGDRGSNDAKGPKGTEGGVTEKDRDRKAKEEKTGGKKEEKKPVAPTEPAQVPDHAPQHDEKEKAGKKDDDKKEEKEKNKGSFGLEKPNDLPDKPHDILPPTPPGGSAKSDPLTAKPVPKPPNPNNSEEGGIIQPFHSFILSLTMIIFSEIGDKTFLVAALMAMRHDRLVVFSAAFSALIAMTVLSAVLGHAVPTLLPVKVTNFAAAILFLFFGAKLLREGLAMSPDEGVGEEMKEVEQELEEKEYSMARQSGRRGANGNGNISAYALESGRGRRQRSDSRLPAPRSPSSSPSPPRSPSPSSRNSITGALAGLNNLLGLLLSPAWVQTFVMTFLGEWGDRSQIATIAMAAGSDYWWITGGAVVGHGMCTAVAVIGGRAIAGRVSMRLVTLGGAGAFVIFGIIYLVEALYRS